MIGLPVLLGVLAASARGWARASAVLLIVASPLVAALTYALGDFDTRPWWEAVSGSLTVAAAVCLLVVVGSRDRRSLRPEASMPTGASR